MIFSQSPSSRTQPPAPELRVGLCAEEFAQAFPFHVVFDPQLRIVQVGEVFLRLCPTLRVGELLSEHLQFKRPRCFSFAEIRQLHQKLFIVELPATGLVLKGQMP